MTYTAKQVDAIIKADRAGVIHLKPRDYTDETLAAALANRPKGSHFDYVHQAWTQDGVYVRCGHPESMACDCYGKLHAGELANVNDLPTA